MVGEHMNVDAVIIKLRKWYRTLIEILVDVFSSDNDPDDRTHKTDRYVLRDSSSPYDSTIYSKRRLDWDD
jgi:hypothetical protein